MVERANTDTVIDTDQSGGDTTGDLLTFHNPVFDRANDTRVGNDQGECVRIDPARGTWECRWITRIAGRGSITVEGPFYDTRDSVLAVTGGTGAFANARGQMRLERRFLGGRQCALEKGFDSAVVTGCRVPRVHTLRLST